MLLLRSRTVLLALLFTLMLLIGCHTDDETLIIENRGVTFIEMMANGKHMFDPGSPSRRIMAGETIKVVARPSSWRNPRHIQAIDEHGAVRFDEVLDWDDLKARDFHIVIE